MPVFSALLEVVLPNVSWEMASKLCDSKNKEGAGKKASFFYLAYSPLRSSSSLPIAIRI